jgi:hypothetical protein
MIIEINLKEDLGAKADIAGMDSLTHDEVRRQDQFTVDVPTTVINAVIDVFYTMLSMEIESIQGGPCRFQRGQAYRGKCQLCR